MSKEIPILFNGDMDCIAEFEHTSSLSATATNAVTERLYFRAGDCGCQINVDNFDSNDRFK